MFKQVPYAGLTLPFMGGFKQERFQYIQGDKAIGKVHVMIGGDDLYLDWIEVEALYRKQGWGSRIVQELFAEFPHIQTISGTADEKAIAFWIKQPGYCEVQEASDETDGHTHFQIRRGGTDE